MEGKRSTVIQTQTQHTEGIAAESICTRNVATKAHKETLWELRLETDKFSWRGVKCYPTRQTEFWSLYMKQDWFSLELSKEQWTDFITCCFSSDQNFLIKASAGTGELAQSQEHGLLSQRTQVQFPAPTRWLAMACNSSSRGFCVLLWPLQASELTWHT